MMMMQPFRKQQRLQRRPMQTFCSKPKNCKPKPKRERERERERERLSSNQNYSTFHKHIIAIYKRLIDEESLFLRLVLLSDSLFLFMSHYQES
jgi:hypothetical protein